MEPRTTPPIYFDEAPHGRLKSRTCASKKGHELNKRLAAYVLRSEIAQLNVWKGLHSAYVLLHIYRLWWCNVFLVVTKCRENLSLKKNRLTNADDTVDFSETAISSCDNDQQFDDGTNRENIKCTTTHERVGIWSHQEQSCHGTASDSAVLHTYCVILLTVNYILCLTQIEGLHK